MWRVADGKQVAAMPAKGTSKCVTTSNDGRWIGAGSSEVTLAAGDVFVWDATTYERVFAEKIEFIYDVDFSPDSTRLVSATCSCSVTVWNIAARQEVQTLHGYGLTAKYSPQGDRIATACFNSVQVWDSNDGCLLVDVKVPVKWQCGLLWCKNHLFVQTDHSEIKQINAATGSTISEWSVPDAHWPCIALPQHGKFIACSARKIITVWDTAANAQLGLIQHTHDLRSIACSSDGQLLATALDTKIIVKDLPSVIFRSLSVRFTPSSIHLYYIPVSPHVAGTRT